MAGRQHRLSSELDSLAAIVNASMAAARVPRQRHLPRAHGHL
ncbi:MULTISPECIES: hypothetical protein [Nocardia]|nr:hypothetical protein [Nocardia elegans]